VDEQLGGGHNAGHFRAPVSRSGNLRSDGRARMSKKASIREQKETARQEARRKARQDARGGSRKSLGAILGLSVATASLTAVSCFISLNAAPNIGLTIDPQLQQLIVILAFAISFLIAFLVFINKHDSFAQGGKSPKSKSKIQAPAEKFGGTLAVQTQRYAKVFDSATARRVAAPASLEEATAFDGVTASMAPPNTASSESPERPGTGPSSTNEARNSNPDRFMSQERLAVVLDDLKRAMTAISTMLTGRGTSLDDYARFGLNLMFAGICACLTRKYALTAVEGQGLLSRLMELTGSGGALAKTFSDNINTYGEVEAFRHMIDNGSRVMTDLLESNGGNGAGMSHAFGAALHDWEASEDLARLPRKGVFLFTEIVNFAGLVDELDGCSVKRILKQHDEAVRNALALFSGEEVQHTGEGILGHLEEPRAAIDCAVDLIQHTDLFSRQNPDVGFDIRVGIHLGEAVEDNGRFIGGTIQTTALVCDIAGGSEIWVSSDIWAACPAYADDLRYCGEFALEGLGESKELYMMLWEPLPDPKNAKMDYQDIGRRK
jgi:class 3 adenylate cyclase